MRMRYPKNSYFTEGEPPRCEACNDASVCYEEAKEYTGCAATTWSGRRCQRWNRAFPHDHDILTRVKNFGVCAATPPLSMPHMAPVGTPCAFPFTHNGRVYDAGECVVDGPLFAGLGWCNTTLQTLPDVQELYTESPYAGVQHAARSMR